jgi:hypothetical protein
LAFRVLPGDISGKGKKNLTKSKPKEIDMRFNKIKSGEGMNDLVIPTFCIEIVSKFQMVGLSD